MQKRTLWFDHAAARLKQEIVTARQRGMDPNPAFFGWGGTMGSQTYLRFILVLTIGTILASLLFYGLLSQLLPTSFRIFSATQSLPGVTDFSLPSVLVIGLNWLVGMLHFFIQFGVTLIVSVLLASLVDRRLRDIRGTQDWHFEILAAAFALSLVPVFCWLIYLSALLLAFVPAAAAVPNTESAPDRSADHESAGPQLN